MSSGPGFSLNRRRRKAWDVAVTIASAMSAALALLLLVVLLWDVASDGLGRLDWEFLRSFPSRKAEKAGIRAALAGSLWVVSLTALIAIPVGVAAAVYLEEYARKGRVARLLELNVSNLAGVPSIVYGVLGLTLFVRGMSLGPSVLAGALTLSLVVLPVVVISAREALRTVPDSLRLAALAVGATKWQAIRHHVLPSALPGILTGVILSVSRALGETAPLIMMGALTYVAFTPSGPLSPFTVLPIQAFNWASRPQPAFQDTAAAAMVVLLVVLLGLNSVAIIVRDRFSRHRNE